MTTIYEVRQGLSNALGTVPGWRSSPYVGEQVNPPMFKVTMPAFDPRYVMGETKARYTFRCYAYYTRVAADAAERALDELAEPTGAGSVIAAVQTSTNWTITVDYAQVTNVGEITVTSFGTDAVEYFVRPFDIEVVW
jgi:hypothetical protein